MATFIFTGDPNAPGTDPIQATIAGIVFPFGEPVAVANPVLAAKLRQHSHFSEKVAPRRGRPPKSMDAQHDKDTRAAR